MEVIRALARAAARGRRQAVLLRHRAEQRKGPGRYLRSLRRSRISIRSASCGGGAGSLGGDAASLRRIAFTPLTRKNTTQATITNLIRVLMKRPYLIATRTS